MMSKLHVINGQMGGHSIDLKGDTVFVGRAPDNDIQIKDPSVSRRHMKIFRIGEEFFIEDLKSQNGTWILGKPLEPGEEFQVAEGMPVALGNVFICLENGGSKADMVTEYSIDLRKPMGKRWRNLPFIDRRITNRLHLEMIYEISTTLMESLEINEICEKILDAIFCCLKRIDSAAILLVDNETGEPREITARSRNEIENKVFHYSRTIVNRVLREGKAVMMANTSEEDRDDLSDSIEMMRVKSIMCVPLIIKSEIRGAMYVHSVDVPYGFRKDDLLLFTGLSTPATVAIENALLNARNKQAEEALQRSEQKYMNLVQKMADAVFSVTLDGRFIFANPRAEGLTGYTGEQLFRMTCRDLLPEDSVPLLERQMAMVATGEETRPFQVSICCADGRRVQADVTLSALRNEKDEVVEIQGLMREKPCRFFDRTPHNFSLTTA